MKKREQQKRSFSLAVWYLLPAVFVLGAAVLFLEILGSRIISPYYGSSVYAWSALITVTLASLALGYWWGGLLADRRPQAGLYLAEIICSGLMVLLIHPLRSTVLSATSPLGLTWGALASSTLLFAPALILLSATGPLAIRLLTKQLSSVGRGVGQVYAISTAGSVVGALSAGFYLIPSFPVRSLLFGLSACIFILGGVGWFLSRRLGWGVGSVAAAALLVYSIVAPRPAGATKILTSRTSFYGNVKVLEEAFPPAIGRILFLDGAIQGALDTVTGEPPDGTYFHGLELLPNLKRGSARALIIGLGGGIVAESYRKNYGLTVDVVEIDPVVVDVAKEYFGFVPNGTVAVEDGRTFVDRSHETYDFVVLDAFASERAPFHLFTREFFQKVKTHLVGDGYLAINTVGNRHYRAWHSMYKTLAAVFPTVRVFPLWAGGDELGNIILVATPAPSMPPVDLGACRPAALPTLQRMVAAEVPPPSPGDLDEAILLTDDYNPIDTIYRDIMVQWRKTIIRSSQNILLYDE